MIHRSMTFNGVDLVEDLGLHYSKFEEKLPEPKTSYVDIVAGTDIDLTEANGSVFFDDGEHTIVFLSLAETEEERMATRYKVLSLTHGKRANYTLSWKGGTFNGRCTTTVRHLTPLADLFTFVIRHRAYRTVTGEVTEFTSELVNNDENMMLTFVMPTPDTYTRVRVKSTASATAAGFGKTVQCSTADVLYNLVNERTVVTGATEVTLTHADWWWFIQEETPEESLANEAHATVSDDAMTLDSTWQEVSVTNPKTGETYLKMVSPEVSGTVEYRLEVL